MKHFNELVVSLLLSSSSSSYSMRMMIRLLFFCCCFLSFQTTFVASFILPPARTHKHCNDNHYQLTKLQAEKEHSFVFTKTRQWLASACLIASVTCSPLTGNAQDQTTPTTTTPPVETTSSSTSSSVPVAGRGQRYWSIQTSGTDEERINANKALVDHVVGTVNTMFYDHTAGASFSTREFHGTWRQFQKSNPDQLASRSGTVQLLKELIQTDAYLPDPFAKYLTREELRAELTEKNDGFLGLGAIVEMPGKNPFLEPPTPTTTKQQQQAAAQEKEPMKKMPRQFLASMASPWKNSHSSTSKQQSSTKSSSSPSALSFLNPETVQDLPLITAVAPFSPAERAGLTVGDRIVSIQEDSFLQLTRTQVQTKLETKYSSTENTYFGYPELTVAKPVTVYARKAAATAATTTTTPTNSNTKFVANNVQTDADTEDDAIIVQAYRPTRVRLSTVATSSSPFKKAIPEERTLFEGVTTTTTVASASITTTTSSSSSSSSSLLTPASATAADIAAATTTTPISPIPSQQQQQQQQLPLANAVNRYASTGGDVIVQWQLLNGQSIFDKWSSSSSLLLNTNDDTIQQQQQQQPVASSLETNGNNNNMNNDGGVGYIRLTRFSRASTAGFVQAVDELEAAGAKSYIIDLRNNYGGVIQEAMLTASALLRDPHSVLCFTMNSRGGFTPHDVEEFVVDRRYPGYLLSKESTLATWNQVKKENPKFVENDGKNWSPPSAYASLHEQGVKRGIHKSSFVAAATATTTTSTPQLNPSLLSATERVKWQQKAAQKPIVLLINEGTASSAEVFASALHDNGRTVALIGAKTYGKGLIQHTFPLPDGGGLRLTVAEYLTPSLHHVSHVGGAQFDPVTGEWVGGGIRPDITCDSKQGIPSNIGADLCVGMALDVLQEATQDQQEDLYLEGVGDGGVAAAATGASVTTSTSGLLASGRK